MLLDETVSPSRTFQRLITRCEKNIFWRLSGRHLGLLSLAKWPCVPLLLQSKVNRDSWTLKETRNRQNLIELGLYKIFKGLSCLQIDELFIVHENTKGTGTGGHCLKLTKTRCTRDITRHFVLIGWSTDGTCWISGQSMHLAWMHLRMAYLGLGITGWASSWTRSAKP